jgi:hypothetical protein
MTTSEQLEDFARQYRLQTRLDECGDKIIPGRRGRSQYFDGDQLCLMVLDGPVAQPSRWNALGGKLWLGDVSGTGKSRVQDVKVTGIPSSNAGLAIRMARVKPKRVMSQAQREQAAQALAKAQVATESFVRAGQSHACH